MKLIKVHITGSMPRYFDTKGNQKTITKNDFVIDSEDFGVEVCEKEITTPPKFRGVCGNFMIATFVKFPNGKTHLF